MDADGTHAVVEFEISLNPDTGSQYDFAPERGSTVEISGISGSDAVSLLNQQWTVVNNSAAVTGGNIRQKAVRISLLGGVSSGGLSVSSLAEYDISFGPSRRRLASSQRLPGRKLATTAISLPDDVRIGVTYIASTAAGFRLMETDGCGAQATAIGNLRSSGLEPFERWQDRNDQSGGQGAVLLRECKQGTVDRRQRIEITGTNFAKVAGAPVVVTMQSKSCDCSTTLANVPVPCYHRTTRACAAKLASGQCPANHDDCSAASVDGTVIDLPVEAHEENRIVVPVVPGFGRYHQLSVTIGSVIAAPQIMRYHRPTVTAWMSEGALTGQSNTLKPDGRSRICYLGHNFGRGPSEIMEDRVEVRIGSEFDADGNPSANLDTSMPRCSGLTWIESLTAGNDEYKGTSAFCCTVPEGTVGARNHSVTVNGQRDDCSTNELLCAFAQNWPTSRTEKTVTKEQFAELLKEGDGAPLFSCGRDDETLQEQAYGGVGELCLDVNSGMTYASCGDADCTQPKALAGFFRLDLDLEFACQAGSEKPCQKDVKPGIYDNVQFGTDAAQDLCFAFAEGDSVFSNGTCSGSRHQCSNRGTDAVEAGKCVFRRPKEAKRALGNEYEPWFDSSGASAEARNQLASLEPRCDSKRYAHLLDPSIYNDYPGLKQSPTCYDIVACTPKTSCLGDNQCADEYQWMRPNCLKWQEENPNRENCTNDDQCRSRSGDAGAGAVGLSSACDRENPEDCARCNLDDSVVDPLTGERVGRCECVGGAPRCGLCTQAVIYDDDRENLKGYFRLNNECQPCPDNPILILVGIALVIVLGSIACWWLQSKKINISIITIGFDYFQVLAIFARINVKWPAWVKSVLQVLSVLNFNIDIAGPECAFPDFDYAVKWTITILLPVIFAGVLGLVFLAVALVKFIRFRCGWTTKTPKYISHGPRLLATFLLIMYCLFLMVVRRALDVFNCNPPDPPDGYTYTEFVSIECEAGICKCGDPLELQARLVPWASLAIVFYAIGFTVFVGYITYFFRIQMKLDQLLRAHGLGEARDESITNVDFAARKCQSKSKRTYRIRKAFNMLYYHFKPGKIYWMVVILVRKFLVALCALMFRANIGFMLSTILLILFLNYVLAVKHRPFMSTMERSIVIARHREKADEADDWIRRGKARDQIPKDAMLHYELSAGIQQLRDQIQSREREKGRKAVALGMGDPTPSKIDLHLAKVAKEEKHKSYYFDYNTLDRCLISCAIFLSIIGLMFESKQFYMVDEATGFDVLNPKAAGFYNTVLVAAGLVLFGSIVYYIVVFLAEIFGSVPKWMLCCFANKKTRHQRAAELMSHYPSMGEKVSESFVVRRHQGTDLFAV